MLCQLDNLLLLLLLLLSSSSSSSVAVVVSRRRHLPIILSGENIIYILFSWCRKCI